MRLQIGICDDEPLFCEDTRKKIEQMHAECDIDIYLCGEDLLLSKKRYDIIFLDIEMPGEDGMAVAQKLRERGTAAQIVFLSSHEEYMPDAFRVKAFRFLRKPVDAEALREVLSEVQEEMHHRKRLVVDSFGTEVMVEVADLLLVRSEGKTTVLHLKDQTVETGRSLKEWSSELEDWDFCRTHKSYLVSLRHIRRVEPDGVVLQSYPDKVPLSRRNYAKVKEAFFRYVEENARVL